MNLSQYSFLATCLFLSACGGDDTSTPTTSPGVDASSPGKDSSAPVDSSTPGKDAESDAATSADAAGTVTLTIVNQLNWCTISVDNATTTIAPPPLVVAPGTVVNLSAAPVGQFVWGFWVGTAGGSHDTNMTTTVKVDADTTVQVCCPIKGNAKCI